MARTGSTPAPHGRPGWMLATVALLALTLIGGSVGLVAWFTPDTVPARAGFGSAAAPPPLAAPAGPTTCAGRPVAAARELRGMWLTTVNNIDWPSRPGLPPDVVRAEYRAWLDLAVRLNHNAVFVHVRPSGDALWPSAFAPWSQWLTGARDGRDPGWDPMAFMVAEAHARNLEFHAWFNPYRGSQPGPDGAGASIAQLAPNHPLRRHPEWAVAHPRGSAGRLYFDPGIPAARTFVEDSMLEAVSRYDIDGVHFDDFFYPYPVAGQDFPDDASFARYGRGFASRADWRRHNVNLLVREMDQRIKALKPWVKFGISPFGIWRNQETDRRGSATRGLQSYDAIYADTRLWVQRGWLDYIVPQLYWHIGFDVADYAKLLPWWTNLVKGTKVQLYIGQADYRVGQSGAWSEPAQLQRQLALNDRYGVHGSVHFSAKHLRADKLGSVSRYRAAHYAAPALVPPMARLPAAAPAPPVRTRAGRDGAGPVTVTWSGAPEPASYAVYRVDLAAAGPARLVGTARNAGAREQSLVDTGATPGGRYAYCVTGLDRSWNEGRPGPAAALS